MYLFLSTRDFYLQPLAGWQVVNPSLKTFAYITGFDCICLFICLFSYLAIYLFMCLYVYLFIYLFIYLSICFCWQETSIIGDSKPQTLCYITWLSFYLFIYIFIY